MAERSARTRQLHRRRVIARSQGRFDTPPRKDVLPHRLYVFSVVATAILAAGQLLLFPRFLSPAQFGLVVLALSVLQAIQQLGDLGFANAAARVTIRASRRAFLREVGLSLSYSSAVIGTMIVVVLLLIGVIDLAAAASVECAVLTGAILATSKLRASTLHQAGDESKALRENLVWQNAPKAGTIVGALTGSPIVTMLLGLISAAVFARPYLPAIAPSFREIRKLARFWLPGLGLVVAAFTMTWADTYVLAGLAGTAVAGEYQAVMRPLLGITYLYIPLLSLLQSSLNRQDHTRVKTIIRATLIGCGLILLLMGVALVFAGAWIWPMYSFSPLLVFLLVGAVLASCVSALFGTILMVSGAQSAAASATVLGALVLAGVSFVAVPIFGAMGAAMASLCGWSIAAIAQVIRASNMK